MTKRKLYFNLPFLLFLIIGTIYITYQQKSTTYQKSEGKIFGTFYHITYQHNKKLDKEILDELNKVDMALSMFNKESIISRINRNEDVQTDSMFETVYGLAQNVSEETDGAFDITVAPLVNAWGFGFKTGNPSNPTVHRLAACHRGLREGQPQGSQDCEEGSARDARLQRHSQGLRL